MTTKLSTGLRNRVLDSGSLKSRLDGGFLDIYSGAIPATADAALGAAVKLVRVSNNSTGVGITFDAVAAAGAIPKEDTEIWSGLAAVAGTPAFYRIVKASDDGLLSTTQERMQGAVGAELLVTGTIEESSTVTVETFVATLPTL